jgi:hypothetical protein
MRMGGGVPQMPTNVSVPAPDWAAYVNEQQGPLAQVIKGFQAFQQTQQANKLFGAQLAQTQAQTQSDAARAQVEQSQASTANQQQALQLYNQFGQVGVRDPNVVKSPQWQMRMKALAAQAGMPDPFGADGSFDKSQFLTPLTDKDIVLLNQMHAGPAKTAILNQHSGVPDSMYTAGPDYTGTELAKMQQVTQMGIHLDNVDETARQRAAIAQDRENLLRENNPLVRAELQAKINREGADATRANADANRAIMQTQELSQFVNAGGGTLRAQVLALRGNPAMAGTVVASYKRLTGMAERAKEQLAAADAAYNDALNHGADTATLQGFSAKRAAAKAAYQQAAGMLNDTYTQIKTITASGSSLRTGMGAKSVNVGGPMTLPEPPPVVTDTPQQNPRTNASTFGQGGYTQGDPYIDTAHLPKGTQFARGPDGTTYYRVPDGSVYDSDGTLRPDLMQQPPQ